MTHHIPALTLVIVLAASMATAQPSVAPNEVKLCEHKNWMGYCHSVFLESGMRQRLVPELPPAIDNKASFEADLFVQDPQGQRILDEEHLVSSLLDEKAAAKGKRAVAGLALSEAAPAGTYTVTVVARDLFANKEAKKTKTFEVKPKPADQGD